uniref:Cytochrome b-c1 complex subunit 8 n=1 Tax=Riptortus pedestris TaxID=329032 RepID=R4WQF3_RIPPE|nr:ubiquinone binding protein [Riptortus pedestris]
MRVSVVRQAKHFGELAYIRGLVTYKLSPFEQKAFAGFIKSIPKTIYRIGSNLLTIAPPFAIGYFIFTETEKKFHQMCRKNPEDYVNDK